MRFLIFMLSVVLFFVSIVLYDINNRLTALEGKVGNQGRVLEEVAAQYRVLENFEWEHWKKLNTRTVEPLYQN